VRIGASIRSFYPPGNPRQIAQCMVERAEAARQAELDSLFVGDHHATSMPYVQNVPILARMLASWRDAPAGALFLLALWDPVLLAEQVGTLAALAPQRFIVQCCVGADPEQFRAMGANPRTRGRDFERNFGVLRCLLAGEPVAREEGGPVLGISPVPATAVEYWVGADVPIAIDRAARIADAWMPGPNVRADEAARSLVYYRERCDAYEREPLATPIRRNIHVAGSERELEEVVRPAMQGGMGVEPDKVIVGTVPQVAEVFRDLARAGFSDVIVRHFMDDQAAVLDSYHRLREVRKLVMDA
jgi:alkanesulfonate monooxygenase SsuD/methylene tetrahydromethanopterin reductase-like flavin-dependent oxidoreductase (luciferase family)